ncbi:hypothetical protein PHMEG_00013872 [Phytophthora megakarya]|uniref:Uncharacterized protein n=1 Tax=Phytophthora megakarya TaxID=4795 RepID=A0A225W5P2_9STRA|nr:hypothetical protein PHMEG_00013872 [Phytophthora megakarya]
MAYQRSLPENQELAGEHFDGDGKTGRLGDVMATPGSGEKHKLQMAREFRGMVIPFHKPNPLINIHTEARGEDEGDAWSRQLDTNGELIQHTADYAVILRNVTRDPTSTRLLAFLKHVLQDLFTIEDMDQGAAQSSSSSS